MGYQYGAGPFKQQQFETAGVEAVKFMAYHECCFREITVFLRLAEIQHFEKTVLRRIYERPTLHQAGSGSRSALQHGLP